MDIDKARLEKLEKFKNVSDQVRIGGKGTARRKKKIVHKNAAADDRKLQSAMKKLNLNTIPTIEEDAKGGDAKDEGDDDVPELVEDFDEKSRLE